MTYQPRPASYYQDLEEEAQEPRSLPDPRSVFERKAHPVRWFFKSWWADEDITLPEVWETIGMWIVLGWIAMVASVVMWFLRQG